MFFKKFDQKELKSTSKVGFSEVRQVQIMLDQANTTIEALHLNIQKLTTENIDLKLDLHIKTANFNSTIQELNIKNHRTSHTNKIARENQQTST
jgi:hypothetical protein